MLDEFVTTEEDNLNIVGRNSSRSVEKCGAVAGSVLRGCSLSNQGLRVRVLQDQKKGNCGGIEGKFLVLDAGDNKHSPSLDALLNQVTDAAEVLEIIRRQCPGCVSAVNATILVLDQD